MNNLHIESLNMDTPLKGELLKFPPDAKIRTKYFAPEDKGHPARANLYMIAWLIEKLTKPGDTILDPNSGAGTLMFATLLGRNVVNMELEEEMYQVQLKNWEFLSTNFKPTGTFGILHGDCRRFLPYKANHVVFSPPYAHLLGRPGPKLATWAKDSGIEHKFDYGKNTAQIGHYSYFNYLIAMKEVYRGLFNSLPS